jgi:hypothetical protein
MQVIKIKINESLNVIGKFLLRFGVGLILVLVCQFSPLNAQQQEITQAQITEIISGNQVYIQNKLAHEKDVAKQRERVSTGKARTELEFNNKAIARLGNDSSLTVGGCGAELSQGKVLINGAVSGCTTTISAGVRGTTYLLAIDAEGNEQIQVLEGEVEVLSRDAAKPIREVVASGHMFSISPRSREFSLRSLTVDEFRAIIEGNLFKGYRRELASLAKIRQVFRQRFPNAELPGRLQDPQKLLRREIRQEWRLRR